MRKLVVWMLPALLLWQPLVAHAADIVDVLERETWTFSADEIAALNSANPSEVAPKLLSIDQETRGFIGASLLEFRVDDLNGDGIAELIVRFDYSGRGMTRDLAVFSRQSGRYVFDTVPAYGAGIVLLPIANRKLIVGSDPLFELSGADPLHTLPALYAWTGQKCEDVSRNYESYFEGQVLPTLKRMLSEDYASEGLPERERERWVAVDVLSLARAAEKLRAMFSQSAIFSDLKTRTDERLRSLQVGEDQDPILVAEYKKARMRLDRSTQAKTPAGAAEKTLAHLVDRQGRVHTLDTETDTISGHYLLTNLGQSGPIAASAADDLLLIVDEERELRVNAYELRGLRFKRSLGPFGSDRINVLLPPSGPHFLMLWVDPKAKTGRGAPVVTRFDKATLRDLGTLPAPPGMGGLLGKSRSAFSADGSRLYVYQDDPQLRVEIYDTRNLRLLARHDLLALLSPGVLGAKIVDVQADCILVVEDARQRKTDAARYMLFTLNLRTYTQSPEILVEFEGEVRLTPTGEEIVISELLAAQGSSGAPALANTGRIHVYDVATGVKRGQVEVQDYDHAGILGVRPQADKMYVWASAGASAKGEGVLMSISLTSLAVVKEIKFSDWDIIGMVFFKRP